MSEPQIASPLGAASPAITPLAPSCRVVLRCREADIDRVSERLGVDLPRQACRSARGDGLDALWLGPDEWLVLSTLSPGVRAQEVSGRLKGILCSVVDVSHRQIALAVQGARAEEILASGCALDLSRAAFPVGMCTRTMFAKTEIVLWRTAPHRFHLEVWRSFAHYLEALLQEAEREA